MLKKLLMQSLKVTDGGMLVIDSITQLVPTKMIEVSRISTDGIEG